MIILDTNVLSALMQTVPVPEVMAWLDRQPADELWITAINVFEVRYGLALLPAGRRRRALEAGFAALLEIDLRNRVLEFDRAAADSAADLAATRHLAGRPVDMRDTQIAGITVSRRARLATRNVRHFEELYGALINPWQAAG